MIKIILKIEDKDEESLKLDVSTESDKENSAEMMTTIVLLNSINEILKEFRK